MPEKFENPDPAHHRHSAGNVFRWAVRDRLTGRRNRQPAGPPAPRVEADLKRIRSEAPIPQATWIGHSSWLLTAGKVHLLFDPVFSLRIGLLFQRYGAPGLTADSLPPLDAVLISHNHYDHLDQPSLRQIAPPRRFIMPTGVKRYFRGFEEETLVELGWWDSIELDSCRITCVPARHWSRRTATDTNSTLWAGFVVETDQGTFYHAGDTAWFNGFAEIRRRFPQLTAAMLPIGAYEPEWFMGHNHLNPEQAGAAFLALGAKHLLPMHWGTFQLTDEPLREPAQRLRAWRKSQTETIAEGQAPAPPGQPRLHIPSIGQTVELK